MTRPIKDRKTTFNHWAINQINRFLLKCKFEDIIFSGAEHIPRQGPFILVANHTSRWDGLITYELVNRPSNYMVSPNELTGFQGYVLKRGGAFPANPRLDIFHFAKQQIDKGEGIIIFPEGTVFSDGTTHPFKSGAARIALMLADHGNPVPVIPAAIHYRDYRDKSRLTQGFMAVGRPVDLAEYLHEFREHGSRAVRTLSQRLHREVCHIRYELGNNMDNELLWIGRPGHKWPMISQEIEKPGLA